MSTAAVVMSVGPVLAGVEQLAAEVPGGGRVRLSWSGTDATVGVRVERTADGGRTWREVVRLSGGVSGYDDRAGADTLYGYRVQTFRGAVRSAWSEPVWVRTPPGAVGAVRVEDVGADGFRLRWSAAAGATTYRVELAGEEGAFRVAAAVRADALTTRLGGLEAGRAYAVRVVAVGMGGAGEPSAVWRVMTVPAAPQGVRAEWVSSSAVRVSFEPVAGATGYVIEREGLGRPFGRLATLKADSTSYDDVQVVAGEAYRYRVFAVNASGTSAASSAVGVSGGATAALAAPVAVRAEAGAMVSWSRSDAVAGPLEPDGYRVERLVGRGSGSLGRWVVVGLTRADAEGFAVRGLKPGEGAWVRVTPLAGGALGRPSEAVWVRATPRPPTGLRRLVAATATSVALTWTAPRGAVNYTLERSVDGVNWAVVASGFPVAAYVDESVEAGRRYLYRVSAANEGGVSRPSGVLVVTTPPAMPLRVRATGLATGGVQVSWDDVMGETGYRVETSRDGVSWRVSARLPADRAEVVLTGLRDGWVRVAGLNGGGVGLFSTVPVTDEG
ncbi:MAG: fibronectin type III domain-containing protein [Tepidisphaerales bacterium]